MHARITRRLRRGGRWLLIGTAGTAGALLTAGSADAATFATFNNGVLTVFGDSAANTISVSRDAAGTILVNNGAVGVIGRTPTVANTVLIQAFTLGGNDTFVLDEANGAMPRANLFGGTGDDRLTGGSGNDLLFGLSGRDTLEGKGGFDSLFGGSDNDQLTGGDADDQAFGEGGDDAMTWNPGDDTDLNEGGSGTDTVRVVGGDGTEAFTATANGARVRFDRLDPAPFAIDIGTSERLELRANGGDDSFAASGNLAALIALEIDGGTGADTLLGSNGIDLLIGGDGNDFVDGQQANDVGFLGAADDVFQWDPGDGSDVVEGQDGSDTMLFNGSGANELFEASATGGRLRFARNVGNIVMDTNDLETVDVRALGGTDTTTINDLSGTDVAEIDVDLVGVIGGAAGDALADTVIVNGTNGDDVVDVFGSGTSASVTGLPALVSVRQSEGANDTLVINALGGDDGVTATTLPAGIIKPTIDGGAGNDTLLGSQAVDVFLGGEGADFVFGDNGDDVGFLGAGDDTFQWNPGDGNDIVEGQADADTMLFFGANASENVDLSANGGRVRFFRDVANVTMDLDDVETVDFRALGGADNITIGDLAGTDVTSVDTDLRGAAGGGDGSADSVIVNGTQGADVFGASGGAGTVNVFGLQATVDILFAEQGNDRLTLNGLGGDDVVDASSLAADAMQLNENGGLGADLFLGSAGDDLIVGGDGDDVSLMDAGDDTFVWNPGDDNDVLEGQAGSDTMLFNGANASENIDISANGGRVLFFRNVANVVMDLNDVETIDFNALGGADTMVVNDLSGTDVSRTGLDLAADGAADSVIARGTNGDDVALVSGNAGGVSVFGLPAQVDIAGSEAGNDSLTIDVLAGDDVIEASGLQAGAIRLVEIGGAGSDVLIGSAGDDVIQGGAGDDVLLGGGGVDVLDGGDGDDIEIQNIVAAPGALLAAASGDQVTSATTADAEWIASHVQIVNGQTVITIGGRSYPLAGTDLSQLVAEATELMAALEPAAPVGDFVWTDTDADGLQDAGEPGVAGVAVRLLDADGQLVAEDVTDTDGRYELTPTAPGPFTFEVVIPTGVQPTLVDVGGDDAVDSDVDPTAVVIGGRETTVRVAVDENTAAGDLDVGLVPPAGPAQPTTTTTVVPTTVLSAPSPTTPSPATLVPTTVPSATPSPTTAVPTTAVPPTVAETTVPEPTVPPTTVAPTTAVPTTVAAAASPTAPPTTTAPAG